MLLVCCTIIIKLSFTTCQSIECVYVVWAGFLALVMPIELYTTCSVRLLLLTLYFVWQNCLTPSTFIIIIIIYNYIAHMDSSMYTVGSSKYTVLCAYMYVWIMNAFSFEVRKGKATDFYLQGKKGCSGKVLCTRHQPDALTTKLLRQIS